MPNKDLKNNSFECPDDIKNHLSSTLRKYRGSDDSAGVKKIKAILNTGSLSYDQMRKAKSFFDNDEEQGEEYILNGGDKMKKWVESELSKATNAIDAVKKTRMDAGDENQYKKTHEKDKKNANPTKVRLPNISKSSNGRNIMSNKVVYESINDELNGIKYLMEYMDTNKRKI